MTQQFRAKPNEEQEQLPKGWQKMWDRPGGTHYYFNTLDHDIQYDIFAVHQIAAKAAAEEQMESPLRDSSAHPDGVVSSLNNTITPSPVLSRNSGSRGDQKMPAKSNKPTTFGGFYTIDDDTTSDDDDEVTVIPPPPKKRRVKAKKSPPMRANHRSQSIPQVIFGSIPSSYASLNSDDDEKLDDDSKDELTEVADYEVESEDLPKTEEFQGEKTLADLGLDDSDDDEENSE